MRLQGIFMLHPHAAHKALEGLTSWLLVRMKGEARCCRELVRLTQSQGMNGRVKKQASCCK